MEFTLFYIYIYIYIYIASDSNRALMLFATGKSLGENGLDWLKIHLVNLHGEKKKCLLRNLAWHPIFIFLRLPLQGRLDYANEMMTEIFDSAEKPLTVKEALILMYTLV